MVGPGHSVYVTIIISKQSYNTDQMVKANESQTHCCTELKHRIHTTTWFTTLESRTFSLFIYLLLLLFFKIFKNKMDK